jgi:hypothetical protein
MVKQNLNRINNQLLKGKKNFFQEKSNPTQIPGKDPQTTTTSLTMTYILLRL